jgi:hypothetical protein
MCEEVRETARDSARPRVRQTKAMNNTALLIVEDVNHHFIL